MKVLNRTRMVAPIAIKYKVQAIPIQLGEAFAGNNAGWAVHRDGISERVEGAAEALQVLVVGDIADFAAARGREQQRPLGQRFRPGHKD